MDVILLIILVIIAGWFINHFYNKLTIKKLKKELKEAETTLLGKQHDVILELQHLSENIKPDQPEVSAQIEQIIHKYAGAEPGIISKSDFCPKCNQQSLKFIRYGVGPLGISNAWYGCRKCGYEFQTQESSCD
jgi:lipopolysaccharide biosynthesis regulator YciM